CPPGDWSRLGCISSRKCLSITSIMQLQKPQSANRKTTRKKVKTTLRPSSSTNIPRRAECGDMRAAGAVARGFVVIVGVAIRCFLSLERDAHLRADHDRIRNITCAAGIDHILQVRLNVTPLRHLKSMPVFQHLLGIGEVMAGDVNTASVVTT